MGLEVQEEVVGVGREKRMDGIRSHHRPEPCGQEKQQVTRDFITGEEVTVAPDLPNLGICFMNKTSGLFVFFMGLLEHSFQR